VTSFAPLTSHGNLTKQAGNVGIWAMRKTGVITAIVVTVILIGCYKYISDESAWSKVEESVIRVQSGLQYESLLLLRSKLADADAAIHDYSSERRFFPIDNERRISEAQNGIFDLGIAIDADRNSGANADAATLVAIDARHPNVSTFIPRMCSDGSVSADASSVASAFVQQAIAFFKLATNDQNQQTGAPSGSYPRFDMEGETRKCKEELARAVQQAAEAAEARKRDAEARQKEAIAAAEEKKRLYWSQFRYHVQLSSFTICTFHTDIDQLQSGPTTIEGGTLDFGVNRSFTLSHADCEGETDPSAFIRITINGQPYLTKWEPSSSGMGFIEYRTTLIPSSR
jgi:hypothetical protein